MGKKKLFIVTTEIESVVLAENEDDAADIAAENYRDICSEVNLDYSTSWDARECGRLPQGWNNTCIPWGSEDDSMCGQYMVEDLPLDKDE